MRGRFEAQSRQQPPRTDQAMSPLRRRMIEDVSIRKFTHAFAIVAYALWALPTAAMSS
jgi:hypothetical protein